MLTVLAQWPLVPALGASALVAGAMACAVGFPALRVKGLMLVVATVAFGEAVRLFFFNFTYQVQAGNLTLGPHGAEGFRQIRYFPENGWSTLDVMLFIWAVVALGHGGRVVARPIRAPAPCCARSARMSSPPRAAASTSPPSRSRR